MNPSLAAYVETVVIATLSREPQTIAGIIAYYRAHLQKRQSPNGGDRASDEDVFTVVTALKAAGRIQSTLIGTPGHSFEFFSLPSEPDGAQGQG